MRILLSILFFFIPACVLNAQPLKSIHVEEYDKYRYQDKAVSKSMSKYKVDLRNALNNKNLDKKFVGFHAYWAGEKYLNYRYDLISDLIYFGFEIDSESGSIAESRDYLTHPVYDLCKSTDTKLHVSIILFGNNKIQSFLSDEDKISQFIKDLKYYDSQRPFDGINLDFETLDYLSRDDFLKFVKKLDKTFPAKDISICIPAVDWETAYDFENLNDYIDFYFLMGYDYYWSGSKNAGPVSPLSGIGINLKYTFNRYEVNLIDKQKIVLGLPWYGRKWQVEDSSYQSVVMGNSEALAYSFIKTRHPTSYYDETYASNYLTYKDDGAWFELWYDDSLAFANKIKYALNEDLLGIGVWTLHYQNNESALWDAYHNVINEVSVREMVNDNDIVKEYYDQLGRRIDNINQRSGQLIFEVKKKNNTIISTRGIYIQIK